MEPTAEAAASTISVAYQPTRGDYRKAALLSAARSMPNAAFGSWFIAIAILPVLNGDLGSVVTLVVGVTVITGFWCIPLIEWATRRRPDLLLGPHELTVDSWGMRFATASMRAEQGWSTFRRVRQVGGAFLLDYGTGANALIPSRAFDSAAEARFRELAERAGKVDNAPPWRGTVVGVVIGVAVAIAFILVVSASVPVH